MGRALKKKTFLRNKATRAEAQSGLQEDLVGGHDGSTGDQTSRWVTKPSLSVTWQRCSLPTQPWLHGVSTCRKEQTGKHRRHTFRTRLVRRHGHRAPEQLLPQRRLEQGPLWEKREIFSLLWAFEVISMNSQDYLHELPRLEKAVTRVAGPRVCQSQSMLQVAARSRGNASRANASAEVRHTLHRFRNRSMGVANPKRGPCKETVLESPPGWWRRETPHPIHPYIEAVYGGIVVVESLDAMAFVRVFAGGNDRVVQKCAAERTRTAPALHDRTCMRGL